MGEMEDVGNVNDCALDWSVPTTVSPGHLRL